MEDIDKQLEKAGITLHEPISYRYFTYPNVAVRVEVAIANAESIKTPDKNIRIKNKFGAEVFFSDWSIIKRDNQSILTFVVSMAAYVNVPIPDNWVVSFGDLCCNNGHEELSPDHTPSVHTNLKPDAHYIDLGWYLPCRFADRLIEALGRANDTFLSGILEDAVIYGAGV